MGVRESFAVTLMVLAVGCTPAMFGQDDDLRTKIPEACQTLEKCLLMQDEAERRAGECQRNAIGYERCSDARADVDDVMRRLAVFQAQMAEVHARVNRRADQQAEERRELLEAQEKEERQRRYWLDDAVASCARVHNDDPCKSANAMRCDEETRATCVDRCKHVLEQGLQSEYARALDECASLALDASASPSFDCHFLVADPTLEARRVECALACKEETEKLAALRPVISARPPPAPRANVGPSPAPAPRPRAASRGGGSGTGVLCCDGTLSPTCACPGHRGCCSHHGGVCGCQ